MRSNHRISRHYILRKMGLIETLCFLETTDNAWWFVKDGIMNFMLIGTDRNKRYDARS